MPESVLHQPRVAWDAARLIAACCGSTGYTWLQRSVGDLLGGDVSRLLAESDRRLLDAYHRGALAHEAELSVIAGLWRARLQDLLREQPELTAPLAAVVSEARHRA